MFRFGASCSKLLFLLQLSVFSEIVFGGDDDAVPSIFSDALENVNHLLNGWSLDYTVDSGRESNVKAP
uniref:Uncharacterized protein n=1 Tax=Ditylenchus dipsaci TaxID=166011 RepID=A0A915E2T2_9BILA